jgi:hypothetical protein
MKSIVKGAVSENPGRILKLGQECPGIRQVYHSVFFLLSYSDVPMMLSGIFFLVFIS